MAWSGRRLLYAAATSDRLEDLAMRSTFLRRRAFASARTFVAGETLPEALSSVRELLKRGLAVSIDRFGENLSDPDSITAVVDEYRELGRAVADLDGDVYLEVVPSNLGIDLSGDFFCEQARQVANQLPAGARLEISAEESHRTPRIIEAELGLAAAGVPVVATVQANLHRSERDARRLVEADVPIRLVKGAYVEPSDVAHAWGEPVDMAFVRLAHQLSEWGADFTLATHDPVIREALLPALHGVGIEMLLGVRPDDALELVERGVHVRVYVPYGSEWFRYWLRRMAEGIGP